MRGVDVALFLDRHWPGGVPEGYATVPPDLTLEVRSPLQTWAQILDKVGEYLEMGVRMVWVIDPPQLRVTVFQQDQEPIVLAPENELDGGAILPGFQCGVSEFFE